MNTEENLGREPWGRCEFVKISIKTLKIISIIGGFLSLLQVINILFGKDILKAISNKSVRHGDISIIGVIGSAEGPVTIYLNSGHSIYRYCLLSVSIIITIVPIIIIWVKKCNSKNASR